MLDMGGGLVHDEATNETVTRDDVSFTSTDGKTTIQGRIWWPQALIRSAANEGRKGFRPHGVVQIAHGMAEYIDRYEPFAEYLCRRGYVVCGHDMVGHGRTTPEAAQRGVLPAHGGRDVIVGDVALMCQVVRGKLAERLGEPADDVPHFLFGHSMGSFVARNYLAIHGEDLAGAIICGTGYVSPNTCAMGNLTARLIAAVHGEQYRSELLHSMADGAYAKAVENARTPFDWLSVNEDNVDAYIADPACGFLFSAGGYATLTDLTRVACDPHTVARYPKNLPLLYIAGEGDPVGSCGEGVKKSAQMAQDAGIHDVSVRLYQGMRHEILNETRGDRVMADIANWMEEHL